MKNLIIGLVGNIGSGKTTAANILVEDFGFTRISFAQPLKEMLIKAEILKPQELQGEKTPFAREMLQKIGTNLIRNQIDPDFWVKLCKKRIESLIQQGNTKIVIDDVRFPNEADFIRNSGGILIKVISNSSNKEDYCNPFLKHESEIYINNIPTEFVIINNKQGLEQLKNVLSSIIQNISNQVNYTH